MDVFALVLHSDPAPMGIGRDVELVVRRGLAKSNRHRFPAITDFSDALRAAAAGRLRETQWAATLAYAAGEVASHDSKGRLGRRVRRLALAAAVVASIWIAFVVGGALNRRSPALRGPATPEPAGGLLVGADPLDARDAEEKETQDEPQPPADGETDDAVEPGPPAALPDPMSHIRQRASSATTRRPASAPRPSVDEDATMPATEPSN
jgi:hypothetical protein